MKKGLMVGAMALVLAGSAAAGTLALAAQQEPLAAELTAVEAAVLRQGSTGGEVKEVQRRLKNWGYYTGAVDGIFGAGTKKAVVWFQQKNGLTADGVVGKATYKALVYIYGRTSQSHRVIAGYLKVTLKSCQKSHKKQTFFAGNGNEC